MSTSPVAVCEDPERPRPARAAGRRSGRTRRSPPTARAVRRPRPARPRRPARRGRRVRAARPRRGSVPLRDQAAHRGRGRSGGRSWWSTSARASRRAARTVPSPARRPHLVLDGAVATARALGARQVHVVLPGDRPLTRAAMETAMDERRDRSVRLVRHVAVTPLRRRTGARGARADGRPAQPPRDRLDPRGGRGAPVAAHPAVERRDLGARRAPPAHRAAASGSAPPRSRGRPCSRCGCPGTGRGAGGGVRHPVRSVRPAEERAAGPARWLPRHVAPPVEARATCRSRCRGCAPPAARWGPGWCSPWTTARSAWTQRIVVYLAGQSAAAAGRASTASPPWRRRSPRSTTATGPDGSSSSGRSGRGPWRVRPSGRDGPAGALPVGVLPRRGRPARRRPLLVDPAPRRTPAAERGLVSRTLRVDWPACNARGVCHELLPEVVSLDEWGYPLVDEVTHELLALAREAVRMCPRLALRLVEVPG